MRTITVGTYTKEDLEEIANKAKDFTLAFLETSGVIKDHTEYKKYLIMMKRPGFFSRVFKKGTENDYRFYMVENKTPDDKEEA